MGEPAAVLYRLGSIINHWNSRNKSHVIFAIPLLPRGLQPKRKNLVCDARLWVSFAEAMRRSDAKTQPKPRKLPSTNSSDWLVWGGMPRHGRPRIAAVCDACRRRKRSAAFERKGRLAAAAADAADGIGHAARSTRRAVCARRGARAAAACEQPGLAATVCRARGSERAVWRRESTPQRGPPSLRGGRRPFRQQVVQLAGWQRDMPSGGSSIIRRCTAGTS